ncbi:MAG: hypothetical protein WA476_09050 [Acidobacteriaceae bacterium]
MTPMPVGTGKTSSRRGGGIAEQPEAEGTDSNGHYAGGRIYGCVPANATQTVQAEECAPQIRLAQPRLGEHRER